MKERTPARTEVSTAQGMKTKLSTMEMKKRRASDPRPKSWNLTEESHCVKQQGQWWAILVIWVSSAHRVLGSRFDQSVDSVEGNGEVAGDQE